MLPATQDAPLSIAFDKVLTNLAMPKRVVTLLLLGLLLLFQSQLWFGKGSISDNNKMQHQLTVIEAKSARLQAENQQLKAEVDDLKNPNGNLEMVEEKARSELGMIKPNEIYVQLAK